MLVSDFKKLVDETKHPYEIGAINHVQIATDLGLNTTFGYSLASVADKIYELIKKNLEENKGEHTIRKVKFFSLEQELIYRYVLHNEDPLSYLMVLNVFKDSCRTGSKRHFTTNDERLRAAVKLAKIFSLVSSSHQMTEADMKDQYQESITRAESMKQLIEMGCRVEIVESELVVKSGLEEIIQRLHGHIQTIGGHTLAKLIFSYLGSTVYNKKFERYIVTRQGDLWGNQYTPDIPYGYLLNICIKYPEEKILTEEEKPLIEEIQRIAILVTNAVYGVQRSSPWAYFFNTGETMIELCTTLMQWDTIYTFPQVKPGTAIEIAANLFGWINEEDFVRVCGFRLNDFLTVAKRIMVVSKDSIGPTVIYASKIIKEEKGVIAKDINLILKFLAHQEPVNQNFKLPTDYTEIDFNKKPLISVGPTKYILMDKSWCAPAIYEAVCYRFWETEFPDFDKNLGLAIEQFIKNKFASKGILTSSGKYRHGRVEGDCDLMVQTEKQIVLLEVKKKPLRKESRSGVDNYLIPDLMDSILFSQLQAGKLELLLRKRGNVELKDKGRTEVINYEKGRIDRLSVTLHEYGAFHSRLIIQQFLTAFVTHIFATHSEDEKIKQKFEELEKKQESWISQYNELCQLDPEYPRYPFFDSWFLSVPQLFEIISISESNEDFYRKLSSIKHLVTGTLDFYREFLMGLDFLKNRQF